MNFLVFHKACDLRECITTVTCVARVTIRKKQVGGLTSLNYSGLMRFLRTARLKFLAFPPCVTYTGMHIHHRLQFLMTLKKNLRHISFGAVTSTRAQ